MSVKTQEKRSALLQAALALFAEQGFNGSSTALIAKRAGVASGTLFFHFNSKEELIQELFRVVRSKIEKNILENVQVKMPVKDRFLYVFSKLLRYLLANPEEFKFMEQYHFSPFSDREDRSNVENEPLRNLLLEAREQQFIKDAPLLFLEAVAFGPIASLAREHATRGTLISDELVQLTVHACWDGLKR